MIGFYPTDLFSFLLVFLPHRLLPQTCLACYDWNLSHRPPHRSVQLAVITFNPTDLFSLLRLVSTPNSCLAFCDWFLPPQTCFRLAVLNFCSTDYPTVMFSLLWLVSIPQTCSAFCVWFLPYRLPLRPVQLAVICSYLAHMFSLLWFVVTSHTCSACCDL